MKGGYMKKGILAFILTVGLVGIVPVPAQATRCADGTYSLSTGQGTCSWHGGVYDPVRAARDAEVIKLQKKLAKYCVKVTGRHKNDAIQLSAAYNLLKKQAGKSEQAEKSGGPCKK